MFGFIYFGLNGPPPGYPMPIVLEWAALVDMCVTLLVRRCLNSCTGNHAADAAVLVWGTSWRLGWYSNPANVFALIGRNWEAFGYHVILEGEIGGRWV